MHFLENRLELNGISLWLKKNEKEQQSKPKDMWKKKIIERKGQVSDIETNYHRK